MRSIKKLLTYCLIFIIVFQINGCGPAPDKTPAELTLWTSSNPLELQWMKIVVEKWNSLNPDIPVKFQPIPEGRSSEEKLMAAIVAKTTPDIYTNINPGIVQQLVQAGALYPVDSIPSLKKFLKERCSPETVEMFKSSDKHLYQVPWKCNPVMMLYNKKYFREFGFKPPLTYSQWLAEAKKIKESGLKIWMTYFDTSTTWWQRFFDFYPLYISVSGGKTLLGADGKADFNDTAAIKVLEFIRKNFDSGYCPTEAPPGDAFLSGYTAVMITGPWTLSSIKVSAPLLEVGVARLPLPDEYSNRNPVYTYGDSKNIAIFSNTKHPGECAKFLEFMLNPENDALFVKLNFQMVYRKNMENLPEFQKIFKETPLLLEFAKQSKFTKSVDSSPAFMEIFEAFSREYIACVIQKKFSPEEALRRAEERVNNIIEEY